MQVYWYLFRRVCIASASTGFILLGALWIVQSLRFIRLIVNHDVSFADYFKLIFFLLPEIIVMILPFCLMVGGAWVYHHLRIHHELLPLRGLGLSSWQIAIPFIILGTLMSFLTFSMNVSILPIAAQKFQNQQHHLKHHLLGLVVQEGSFSQFKDTTLFVESVKDSFKNVFLYTKNQGIVVAREGNLDTDKRCLTLQSGEMVRPANEEERLSFDHMSYVLEESPKERFRESTSEINLFSLLFPSKNLSEDIRHKMLAEANRRLAMPWLCLLQTLIMSIFMLKRTGTSRSRFQKRTLSLSFGLCIGIFFLLYEATQLCVLIPMGPVFLYGILIATIIGGFWKLLTLDKQTYS